MTTKSYAQTDYATDMNSSPVVKEFLKSLNSGRTSIESLPIADDRNVLPKTACLFVHL